MLAAYGRDKLCMHMHKEAKTMVAQTSADAHFQQLLRSHNTLCNALCVPCLALQLVQASHAL